MRQTMLARAIFALVACAFVSLATAAEGDATPGAGGGRRGGGGGGNFPTREEMTKRADDAMKTGLGVTDEEFTALKPKIEAVQKARAATRTGGFGQFGGGGFGGGRGGRGGAGGAAAGGDAAAAPEKTEIQKKTDALKGLLDNKESDPKAVQEALAGLRAEREKGKETLKKAQTDLKELLTAKQEAYLVFRGDLE